MGKYLLPLPSSVPRFWKAGALDRRGSIDSLYLSPLPGAPMALVMWVTTGYQTPEQPCHLFTCRSPASRWWTWVSLLFYFEIYWGQGSLFSLFLSLSLSNTGKALSFLGSVEVLENTCSVIDIESFPFAQTAVIGRLWGFVQVFKCGGRRSYVQLSACAPRRSGRRAVAQSEPRTASRGGLRERSGRPLPRSICPLGLGWPSSQRRIDSLNWNSTVSTSYLVSSSQLHHPGGGSGNWLQDVAGKSHGRGPWRATDPEVAERVSTRVSASPARSREWSLDVPAPAPRAWPWRVPACAWLRAHPSCVSLSTGNLSSASCSAPRRNPLPATCRSVALVRWTILTCIVVVVEDSLVWAPANTEQVMVWLLPPMNYGQWSLSS